MASFISMRPKLWLRFLLAAVTAIVIWGANYRVQHSCATREQQALSALSKGGARVLAVRADRPLWLVYIFGPSFHAANYIVYLPPKQVTAENIRLLEQIPHLWLLAVATNTSELELADLKLRFPNCKVTQQDFPLRKTSRGGATPEPLRDEPPVSPTYPTTGIAADAPVLIRADEGAKEAQPEEHQHAIEAARAYLERTEGKPVDATFTARRSEEGFSVFVEFVARDEHGRRLYVPGGHSLLKISKDWKVIEAIGGA